MAGAEKIRTLVIEAGGTKVAVRVPPIQAVHEKVLQYQGAVSHAAGLSDKIEKLMEAGNVEESLPLSSAFAKVEYALGDLLQDIFHQCVVKVNGKAPKDGFFAKLSHPVQAALIQNFGRRLMLAGDVRKNS